MTRLVFQTQWEMSVLTNKWCQRNWYTSEERMLKLNSRWIKVLNVKKLNNQLFEENQRDYLHNIILERVY